ncbi:DUF4245 domain-containing protein [Kocuria massiliensis]|uniref:DUF4245 domain-containing protein n=1 Tax=Kocuria massiliensis TaxID=1926282 RepID=UPI0022B98E13|nr:DUF4245 domain-containing protein [Kocuria massiliensis]
MSQSSPEHPEPRDGSATDPTEPAAGDDTPITPQLTESQAKRLNTPLRAMVFSMIALLLILLPFLWLVPRPDNESYRPEVDLTKTAQEASEAAGYTVAAPQLNEPWHANFARWNSGAADGVPFWETGFVTPSQGFITISQTNKANPTWTAQKTNGSPATGHTQIGGADWETHVKPGKKDDSGGTSYVANIQGTTIVLSGDGTKDEFSTVAEHCVTSVKEGPQPQASSTAPSTDQG